MPYPAAMPETGATFCRKSHHDTYPEINPATQSNCTGKSVLITGASKGIGRATALSFAAAGASHIIVAARSSFASLEPEIAARAQKAGNPAPTVLALSLDVQDSKSISAAAAEVTSKVGRLDILYNNAGYLESWKPLADSDPEDWWRTWDINIRGLYLVTRAFLPLLLKGGDKTIVNTSSIGAHVMRPGASAYQTTKFAVCRFSEFVMAEYADQGVLCYSIHPGGVPTELALTMPPDMHAILGDTPELSGDAFVWLTQKKREWLAGRYVSLTWDMPELVSREKEIVEGDKLKIRLVV